RITASAIATRAFQRSTFRCSISSTSSVIARPAARTSSRGSCESPSPQTRKVSTFASSRCSNDSGLTRFAPYNDDSVLHRVIHRRGERGLRRKGDSGIGRCGWPDGRPNGSPAGPLLRLAVAHVTSPPPGGARLRQRTPPLAALKKGGWRRETVGFPPPRVSL